MAVQQVPVWKLGRLQEDSQQQVQSVGVGWGLREPRQSAAGRSWLQPQPSTGREADRHVGVDDRT